MAIVLTINAEDAADLRKQLHVLLGAAKVTSLTEELLASAAPGTVGAPAPAPVQVPNAGAAQGEAPAEILEQKQEVKPRRAHRKAKDKVAEPSEPSHDGGAPATPARNGGAGEFTATDTISVDEMFGDIDPVAAQAVKDEILPQLRDLFVSGKVKQVRAILDKFGEGAKSIPEIDAKQFPAIRDFMATAGAV